MLTAEEFERQYAERSGTTVEWLRERGRVVRPCHCGEGGCKGWVSVNRESWEEDQRMRRDSWARSRAYTAVDGPDDAGDV